MNREEREQWEQETFRCLERTIEGFGGTRGEVLVEDLRLEGAYPETQIVITHTPRGESQRTKSYQLWGDVFQGPDGGRTTPSDAASMIHTWLGGG